MTILVKDNFKKALTALFIITTFSACSEKTQKIDYQNTKFPTNLRVTDLISKMTLEEKIEQLSGIGFDTRENTRLGIPAVSMADGPAGVRKGNATAFPAPVAMAASWDPELLYQVGNTIGREAESKGISYMLGPAINIHRYPLGGRNFESYGEDPFLTGEMAASYIQGIQANNVLAAAKHFTVNNQEWNRSKIDVQVSERALREIYFPGFKAAVQKGKTQTVMTAYNVVNGIYSSENNFLLNQVLKDEWGFEGYVVSDWAAVKSTIATANSGLDLEMPFGEYYGEKLLQAVKQGKVSEEIINEKIRRIMSARMTTGIFDTKLHKDPSVIHKQSHKNLARKVSEESIVLLKNEHNILPLDKTKIKKIALIGPNAIEAVTGAGGSSMVVPTYSVSPYDGIKALVKNSVELNIAPGIAITNDILPISSQYLTHKVDSKRQTGLLGEYFTSTDLSGEPVMTRIDKLISFFWSYSAPHSALHAPDDNNHFSIQWNGQIHPPKSGEYTFTLMHPNGARLYINNKLIIDKKLQKGKQRVHQGVIKLTANETYDIKIEYFQYEWESGVKLGWTVPGQDLMKEAIAAAKNADIAIIFAGLSNRHEGEGNDRESLNLINQDKLIAAVSGVNPNTIVVLETGTTVSMSTWQNKVSAIIQAWYPGQEGGNAIANILFGNVNPSGKLPFSFIQEESHSPAFVGYKSPDLKARYDEGIFVGYRYLDKHKIDLLYPFGHGLSYTEFSYSNLTIKKLTNTSFKVSIEIKNTGDVSGKEVIQLYVNDKESEFPRPIKELKAFKKINLNPNESKIVEWTLNKDAFSYFNPQTKEWTVEKGEFSILVGASSSDIRLSQDITLK